MVGSVVLWLARFVAVCRGIAPPPPPGMDMEPDTYVYPLRDNGTQGEDATISLRYLYVNKGGATFHTRPHNTEVITIAATASVRDSAMEKTARTVSGMIKYMPEAVFSKVATGRGIGLFTKAEGLTVYPEMERHADSPACHGHCTGSCSVTCIAGDGRKYSTIGGLTLYTSFVKEGNVLCNSHGDYHGQLNVVGHEFAHQIMSHLDFTWRNKIYQAYNTAHEKRTWTTHSYAMRNHNEYFAEASGSFFLMDHLHVSTTGGMNLCGSSTHVCTSLSEVRSFIHQHDPLIYAVLEYVYTGNQPQLNDSIKPCM